MRYIAARDLVPPAADFPIDARLAFTHFAGRGRKHQVAATARHGSFGNYPMVRAIAAFLRSTAINPPFPPPSTADTTGRPLQRGNRIVQLTMASQTKRKSPQKRGGPHKLAPAVPDAPEPQRSWPAFRSYILLTALTLACLVPFCGKAFHIDDALFVWAAQQIAKHPLNPYGFNATWYSTPMPMSEITKNPPLASYYSAAIGAVTGWSEPPLHLAFVPLAIVVILGTYFLARRLTRHPVLAAAATLLTPGFLVSSTNLMCDTMMLAFWILAVILWLEGLDRENPLFLWCSGLLIALCILTKYFGAALIPLLLIYSIARQRRFPTSALYLLIPGAFLAGYQYWTHALYHHGLVSDAADYALQFGSAHRVRAMLIGLSFAGGCALPAITFIPVVWYRRAIFLGCILAVVAGLYCALGSMIGPYELARQRWNIVSVQFALFATGGICILSLAFSDWWKHRDADSLLLALWALGTFAFATLLNWTVNGRSLLPLIPVTGILLARRVDRMSAFSDRAMAVRVALPLALAGIVSLWVTAADAKLAGSARRAAEYIRDESGLKAAELTFQGHWGFQYYMQSFGFRPTDLNAIMVRNGAVMVIPENNTNTQDMPPQYIASMRIVAFDADAGASTMSGAMGSGFYSDVWGPLPYGFGSAPQERYAIITLALPADQTQHP